MDGRRSRHVDGRRSRARGDVDGGASRRGTLSGFLVSIDAAHHSSPANVRLHHQHRVAQRLLAHLHGERPRLVVPVHQL